MSNRSDRLIAVRLVGDDSAAHVVFWREGDEVVLQYRKAPDAASPGARWKPRSVIPSKLWPKVTTNSAKAATVGTVQGWLSGVIADSAITIEGVWTVDFSDEDNEALDGGAAQPNNLFTKIGKRFSSPVPRSFPVASLREAAEWIVSEPMANIDGDLDKYTTSILTSVPVAPVETVEGEDEGILLSNGKTRFLPRVMASGILDVQFMRMARANGLIVLLLGPPGTGKSVLVEAAFHADYEAAGLAFNEDALIVGTEDTTVSDIIGGTAQDPETGVFFFKPGKAIKCAQAGVPLFMDEALLTDPRVLSTLYPLIDGRGVLPLPEEYGFVDEVSGMKNAVKAQPGFTIVFAGNPNVPGAVISEALKSRCALRPEYRTDWDTVERLLGPAHEEICRVFRNMDAKLDEEEVREAPQMREALAYRDTAAVFGTQLALSNLVSFFDSDSDRDIFLDVVARTMHVSNIPNFRI